MNSSAHRIAIICGLLGCLVCCPRGPASAQPRAGATTLEVATTVDAIPNDVRAEASWRFDRGVELYNGGDYAGALVEFERAFALTKHAFVLFNIGLVHAKIGNSVACLRALEPLVQQRTPSLSEEHVNKAREILAQHRPRVGLLDVKSNVDDAVIQIDNVEVATTPTEPIRVTAGEHVLSLFAPDHEPRRVAVSVAGEAKETVQLELLPTAQALAHLEVETSAPDVQVFAGGEYVGRTPFTATVSFKPGVHELTFRRQGYRQERRTVALHPGSRGALTVQMTAETDHPSALGLLSLDVREANAVVWIDGQPRLDFAGGMRLPLGEHRLRVQRAGYYDLERQVLVTSRPSSLAVQLFPTSETLSSYEAGAQRQRLWSWLALGSGAVVAAGSATFLIWNQEQKADAERAFDSRADEVRAGIGQTCPVDDCEDELRQLGADLRDKRDRDLWGWLGVGLGAAGIATGISLRVWGDDPEAFRPDGGNIFDTAIRLYVTPTEVVLTGQL